MKGDFKPRTLNFLKKNRFIVNFPESFNIPQYQLRSVKIPQIQLTNGWKINYSNCEIIYGLTVNDDLVKTLMEVMEKMDSFDFNIELLDSVGVVVEKYSMVGLINRIEIDELDNGADGNISVKISLSINNFKAQ